MLAYCDYIADTIKKTFRMKFDGYVKDTSRVFSDLDPVHGSLVSTKKVVFVRDYAGKVYKITVEETEDRTAYLK